MTAKPFSTPAFPAAPAGDLEPAKLGILLFIAIEIMFFGGLISAFLVFRMGPAQWPPAGQPRLPLEVTAVNTLVLLLSGFSSQWSWKSLRAGKNTAFLWGLGSTFLLGAVFLVVQGGEWIRMLHFGLTAQSNIFGGFFYALVGLHGLHATGGLLALLWVGRKALKGAYNAGNSLGVDLCRTYWFFVVGLWPVLFVLVYL